jgi:beta-lactamase regulating signal transducer with metallopeptidase domain
MIRTISETLVAIGNSIELTLLFKATFAVALGLTITWLARRARASLRHLVLMATFGALVALPIAITLVPAVSFQVQSSSPAASPVMATASQEQAVVAIPQSTSRFTASEASSVISFSTRSILLSIWGVGAVLFLVPLVVGLWKIRQVRRSGLPWRESERQLLNLAESTGIRRRVDVMIHDQLTVPVTCGMLRPAILLPSDAKTWSELDLQRVFVHELEHVKRLDWLTHVSTRAICALYWFHPLVWIAWRQVSLEAERACDDAVVVQNEREEYADQLVTLAQRLSNTLAPPLLSMANRSDLSSRVSAILDLHQSRGRTGMVVTFVGLFVAVAITLGIAPVRAVSGLDNPPQQVATQRRSTAGSGEQSDLNEALLKASRKGKLAEITALLDSGADVNAAIDGDGSPLIVASGAGEIRAVTLLLDRGADVNLAVEGDGNPIIAAAAEGHVDIVKLLLNRGANIDLSVPGDENALIQASGSGHLNVVKLLVTHGANLNMRVWAELNYGGQRTGEWRTPLSEARKGRQTAVIEFLISAGARD